MTKETYIRMTDAMRSFTARLPFGAAALRLPTYVCAAAYLLALLTLMLRQDIRLLRALLVPAACFLAVTVMRPVIGRQRPYDRFGVPPVGNWKPGKGKSMPSRHTASAAAITFAVIYAFSAAPLTLSMIPLCLLIAVLRVLSGQHYISDVLAAILISALISVIGYTL